MSFSQDADEGEGAPELGSTAATGRRDVGGGCRVETGETILRSRLRPCTVQERVRRKRRVAADVGGTFTDIYVLNEETGGIQVAKVPSTPDDPMKGVMSGVAEAEVDLHDVVLFSHGTTVATNALITRRFAPAATVTTRGFRDVIEIRRGTKPDLWDAYKDVAPPYIDRRHRLEVTERVDYAGTISTPLDEAEARQVAAAIRRQGISTVAICFINSYANPAHEQRISRDDRIAAR